MSNLQYYEKLRNLFITIPEIKTDLQKVGFGSEIYFDEYSGGSLQEYGWDEDRGVWETSGGRITGDYIEENSDWDVSYILSLVGNDDEYVKNVRVYGYHLEERHMYLFCLASKIEDCRKFTDGRYVSSMGRLICKFDNMKKFHEQDELVYKGLYEYFIEVLYSPTRI